MKEKRKRKSKTNDRCSEECDARKSERKGKAAIAKGTPCVLKRNRSLLHGQNNTKKIAAVARTKQHEGNWFFTDKNNAKRKRYRHKACSYTVGFFSRKRPFSTEAQIGLSYTIEKGLLRLNFFRLSFPTWRSSRKSFCQSKNSVEKFCTCFLNPSHRSSHHKPHTHKTTHPYQVPHSSIIQQRRRCLGYHCCCFSPQVSVVHS